MRRHLRTRSFTEDIASQTENHEIKRAAEAGALHILCDPYQKKFWFACCPEHLWDTVIAEIKSLTDFVPLIDELDFEKSEKLALD